MPPTHFVMPVSFVCHQDTLIYYDDSWIYGEKNPNQIGTFIAKERSARVGRNPKTGQAREIDASMTIRFIPGKAFKDLVNQAID